MKRVNKRGPQIVGDGGLPELQPVEALSDVMDRVPATATVIDLADSAKFASGHVPQTINISAAMLAGWAGWVVDYSKPVYLIADSNQLPEAIRVLRKLGIDDVRGYFDAAQVRSAGLATQSYQSATPAELSARIESGAVNLIDVRSDEEWKASRVAQAEHHFLGRLPDQIAALPGDKPIVAHCQGGGRSAIAASLLQAAGLEVINMTGGFGAWTQAGLPIDKSTAQAVCDIAVARCS